MNLFCRHDWKFVRPILIDSKPHISAICSECGEFIKHLNKTEKQTALLHGIKVEKDRRKKRYPNRQHRSKNERLKYARS
jgi:hypothetical protein